jgi:hypothetical protein
VALALGGAVSTASVVVAGVAAVLGVVGYQNRRVKLSSELGSTNWLLRRRAPYATEAQSVMAAVLRGLPRGDLQQLLADGLAHAGTLEEQ